MLHRKTSLLGVTPGGSGQFSRVSMGANEAGGSGGLNNPNGPPSAPPGDQPQHVMRRVSTFVEDVLRRSADPSANHAGIGAVSEDMPFGAAPDMDRATSSIWSPDVEAGGGGYGGLGGNGPASAGVTRDSLLPDVTLSQAQLNARMGLTYLDSPKGRMSLNGIPTVGTGGGHGELPPTNMGGHEGGGGRGSHAAFLQHYGAAGGSGDWSAGALASPTSKATPLARHVTTRALLSTSIRQREHQQAQQLQQLQHSGGQQQQQQAPGGGAGGSGGGSGLVRYRESAGSATQLMAASGSNSGPVAGLGSGGAPSSPTVSFYTPGSGPASAAGPPLRSSSFGKEGGRFSNFQRAATTSLLTLETAAAGAPSAPSSGSPVTPQGQQAPRSPALAPSLTLPTSPPGGAAPSPPSTSSTAVMSPGSTGATGGAAGGLSNNGAAAAGRAQPGASPGGGAGTRLAAAGAPPSPHSPGASASLLRSRHGASSFRELTQGLPSPGTQAATANAISGSDLYAELPTRAFKEGPGVNSPPGAAAAHASGGVTSPQQHAVTHSAPVPHASAVADHHHHAAHQHVNHPHHHPHHQHQHQHNDKHSSHTAQPQPQPQHSAVQAQPAQHQQPATESAVAGAVAARPPPPRTSHISSPGAPPSPSGHSHSHGHSQIVPCHHAPGLMPVPPFVARQLPANGLVWIWPDVPKAMRAGTWAMSEYTITRQLHNGYASCVYKATCHRSGADVVLKAYTLSSLSDFLRNQMLRELNIHIRLQHPSVVQILAAFREGDLLVIVLEYVRGGSLDRARRKLGGRMTEQQALELVMAPLLRTLHYLHTQTIVHRDIKPANLLFTPDWKLKVCDYGVSICLSEERAVTRTGSRDYMAPEVNVCPLKRTPADNKENPQMAYGAAVDVWSVGALAYELLVGFTPFPGGPPATRKGDPTKTLVFPSSVSNDARNFVLSCLEQAPGDRPTIQQLLKHRWLLGVPGGADRGAAGKQDP